MDESIASATAMAVSLMRAVYTRTDPLPILNDPWGEVLVPHAVIDAIQQGISAAVPEDSDLLETGVPVDAIEAWAQSHPALANVIIRSRYTEDALQAATARGVKQYVLIGAGFDSYALRMPADARPIDIYEIDHPATQNLKRQRLAECEVDIPESVHFLAADLAKQRLSDVLSSSSFRTTEPAFFSLLGVTMYLSYEDNMATLREIALCGSPGSELVFSYIDQQVFTHVPTTESTTFNELQQSVTSIGEPFLSGFDPSTLEQDLLQAGFQLAEDLDDTQVIARYVEAGSNRLRSAPQSRIARATVVD